MSRLAFAGRLVVDHFWRDPPDQRWSRAYTTPLMPAKTVPRARLKRKPAKTGLSAMPKRTTSSTGPGSGAKDVAADAIASGLGEALATAGFRHAAIGNASVRYARDGQIGNRKPDYESSGSGW